MKIMILGKTEAENFLRQHGALPGCSYAYLSISDHCHDRTASPLIYGENCQGYLPVAFIDVECEDLEFNGGRSISDEQAKDIAHFIYEMRNVKLFISQCQGGISRSAAVAQVVNEAFNIRRMKIGPPKHYPNSLVYAKVRKALIQLLSLPHDWRFFPLLCSCIFCGHRKEIEYE